MTSKRMVECLKRHADAMYNAAQNLTADTSQLHKAMEDYHQFIINEYSQFRKSMSVEGFNKFINQED